MAQLSVEIQFPVHYILKNDLMQNAKNQGQHLISNLNKFQKIKEVRGKGLMIGAETNSKASKIVANCSKRGLLINSPAEKVLRFLPPLTINKKIINNSLKILKSEFCGKQYCHCLG